jgi:hypothetical protein
MAEECAWQAFEPTCMPGLALQQMVLGLEPSAI